MLREAGKIERGGRGGRGCGGDKKKRYTIKMHLTIE